MGGRLSSQPARSYRIRVLAGVRCPELASQLARWCPMYSCIVLLLGSTAAGNLECMHLIVPSLLLKLAS